MNLSLPEHMQAVEISRPGGPEVLQIVTRPLPRLKAGEVLIRVAAAGVNRPDCLQRAGCLSAAAGRLRSARTRGCRAGGPMCRRCPPMAAG